MAGEHPRTGPRHEPERTYEHAADSAEASDRALEPKAPQEPLKSDDAPGSASPTDPHHRLNTPVGRPDPDADSDPYREATSDDDADRASGSTGAHQGAEQ